MEVSQVKPMPISSLSMASSSPTSGTATFRMQLLSPVTLWHSSTPSCRVAQRTRVGSLRPLSCTPMKAVMVRPRGFGATRTP